MADIDEREEELTTLAAIYPELVSDAAHPPSAQLELAVIPARPLTVRFVPPQSLARNGKHARAPAAYIERDVALTHLPPLRLHVTLPDGYPAKRPPHVQLRTESAWLPETKLRELERDARVLWEEYGRAQVVFAYIDHVQQAADRGFDLLQSPEGCLVLPTDQEAELVAFDAEARQAEFDAGTYDCGVCLERKKGTVCYRLRRCGHVFCRQCLQDFYNAAIAEGDVAGVRCLAPDCGKGRLAADGKPKKHKTERTLNVRELLAMGIDDSVVRRYVEMKRKKKIEADKATVYCPRTWCQGPAKSSKYPLIPVDLSAYPMSDSSPDSDDDGDVTSSNKRKSSLSPLAASKPTAPSDSDDRLAVCEKCQLAFCRVCFMGWHGSFARCIPRDPTKLSAEDRASYDYIRKHTSPCPTCSSPTQKTMGCNHMKCFQCATHFCYLCAAWLEPNNPYRHFNTPGFPCYQKLWVLEEGDEGQAPQNRTDFGGPRAWEQLAIEVAREADAHEAAGAAAAAVAAAAAEVAAGENERVARMVEDEEQRIMAAMLAQVRLEAPRDERHPNPARQPAVRAGRRPPRNLPPEARPAARAVRRESDHQLRERELQRFLALAQRDEEDGWDSDELGDHDEDFNIREL